MTVVWEHKVIDLAATDDVERRLSSLGIDGWELVGVQTIDLHAISGNPSTTRFFLKRTFSK